MKKKLVKKLAVMAAMMVMTLIMAVPVFAGSNISIGSSGFSTSNTTYCSYVKTGLFKKTIVLKQKKGTLTYKKVNGRTTNKSSYAKYKVVIKENNKNGKVVASKTWNSETLKFKGKANKTYFLEVYYVEPVSGEVLVGPLYRQDGWKKYAFWTVKTALF